jgi:formylglycine-generating enzyme required for sulfatase activity
MYDDPQKALQAMLAKFGHGVIREPQRAKGILLDYCPGQKSRVRLLTAVLENGMVRELADDGGKILTIMVPRLVERLHEDYGYDRKLSRWALEAWVQALRLLHGEDEDEDQQQFAELKQKAGALEAKGDFADAHQVWQSCTDPAHARECTLEAQRLELLAKARKELDSLLNARQWQQALAKIADMEKRSPSNPSLAQARKSTQAHLTRQPTSKPARGSGSYLPRVLVILLVMWLSTAGILWLGPKEKESHPPSPPPPDSTVEERSAGTEKAPETVSSPTPTMGRITVIPEPSDATVKIMNIVPKYHDGIELKPGRYRIRVEKTGYKPKDYWISLEPGEHRREAESLIPVSQAHKPGEVWTEPHTGMEFVWVPEGCFQMGCGSWTSDCYDNEKPVHEVCLDGFWMGKYEVTQAQWEKVMGNNPSGFKGPNNPVERVSWNDAQKFIKKLNSRSTASGLRLPTEAEWEYACRGGGRQEKYCGGNNVNSVAWYNGNSRNKTRPVGGRDANALDIFDMSGNVWEWVEDVYNSNAYSQPNRRNNPIVTGGGSFRVYRGGSWLDGPRCVRTANRDRFAPDYRYNNLGFRLLRTD